MDTGEVISLIALIVAILAGVLNFFYTHRQFELATKPILWLELSCKKNYDKAKYHAVSHAELGSYRVIHHNDVTLHLKNLSSTTAITELNLHLQFAKPILGNMRLARAIKDVRMAAHWKDIYFTIDPGDNLNPLEERKIISGAWDDVILSILPDDVSLVIRDGEQGIRYAHYTANDGLAFYLSITVKYKAGIANSPEYTIRYDYEIMPQMVHSTEEHGVFWHIVKVKRGVWTI